MDKKVEYLFSNNIPSFECVDLKYMPAELSNGHLFKQKIFTIIKKDLPQFFPNVPDIDKAKKEGIVLKHQLINKYLMLPKKLLNSTIFDSNPILRGPIEEIILAYSSQRSKQNLSPFEVTGDSWSQNFYDRLGEVVGDHSDKGKPELDPYRPHFYKIKSRHNNQGFNVVRGKVIRKRSSL